MKTWTKDNSIGLSLCCVWVFAVILLAVDASGYWLVRWYAGIRYINFTEVLIIVLYVSSIFGWICLWCLRALLRNMQNEKVFVPENVSLLRRISWCCASAAAIILVCALFYLPMLIPAVAAAFMMLIVRVVKNVFQQACSMKDELDLTI